MRPRPLFAIVWACWASGPLLAQDTHMKDERVRVPGVSAREEAAQRIRETFKEDYAVKPPRSLRPSHRGSSG